MERKKFILLFRVLVIFISVIGAYASDFKPDHGDLNYLLDETNESDLLGCCSIACQLDGNNSIFAFRRDAKYSADIHIEKINWHGKDAIKQYKTDGNYFCQVIVTDDGWTIGFGGLDDGEDNEKIEEITGNMVAKNTIDNDTLQEIQDIKRPYGRGHALIKAPDGEYGVAMATTHFTGKLKPGDYISVPNKPEYVRSSDIKLNASDKVKIMNELEITDGYGIDRRDITTFFFHEVANDTFKGNITNITLSNDDGSTYAMNSGGKFDNLLFNGTLFKGENIPIAPKYQYVSSIEFPAPEQDNGAAGFIFNILFYVLIIILIGIIFVLVIRTVNKIRYARKRKRQYNRYYNDRYRYR